MDETILRDIYESLRKGETVALAVITEEIGSSPRKNGSIMAVWKDGTIKGSVGGGKIEYTIVQKAISCIENKVDQQFEYKLNDIGMQCGGTVKGYIKVFYPRTKLIIIGAGHISEKLNQLAKVLDFHTVIMDERSEFANKERFPDADEIIVEDYTHALERYEFTEKDYIVIVTKGHDSDKTALQQVIHKKNAYIGMIGSTKKIRFIFEALQKEGITKLDLQQVYAPMGLDLSTNEPHEIAFGILSEILLLKNKGSLQHKRDVKKVWE